MDAFGGHDGVTVGRVAYAPGVVGRAFRLQGDGYIRVEDSPELDLQGQFSLAAWIRYNDLPDFLGVLAKRESDAPVGNAFANYGINVSSWLGLGTYFDDPAYEDVPDDFGAFEASRVPPPPVRRWFHLVSTVEQQSNERVAINTYLNGVRVRRHLLPGDLARTVNDVALVIGASSPRGGEEFVGLLDEVAIYSKALQAPQVRHLYMHQRLGARC